MKLKGKILYDDDSYQVEVEAMGLFTFGDTLEEALTNTVDAAESLLAAFTEERFGKGCFKVKKLPENEIEIECSQSKEFTAMILKQLRGIANMSLKDLAMKMGKKSANSIAQYEHGTNEASLTNLESLLGVLGYELIISAKNSA